MALSEKNSVIAGLKSARAEGRRPVAPDADLSWADLSGADLSGADLGRADLGGADLRDANLRRANLSGADLRWADLSGADLSWADLRDANLRDANLRWTNLRRADLRWTNLRWADLRDANLRDANLYNTSLGTSAHTGGILEVSGLPSGIAFVTPTLDGWQVTVGCWNGTLTGLRTLIAGDEDWPEARDEEIARRRPSLQAFISLAEAHIALHPTLIDDLAARWAPKEDQAS